MNFFIAPVIPELPPFQVTVPEPLPIGHVPATSYGPRKHFFLKFKLTQNQRLIYD